MSESKFDSRPGVSGSRFDSRHGVAVSRFDSRPGTRSSETTFLGKSPRRACVRLLLLALATAVVAGAFAGSVDFRTWLRVEANAAPWAAALSGGVATLLLVCAVWTWISRLRWVAVSPEGLRWRRGPRARHCGWDQYVGVHQGTIEVSVWGEELKAGKYADVEFRNGRSLRVSTHTVHGYEDLVAEIQTTAADAHRVLFPSGFGSRSGSQSGLADPDVVACGPLRVHPAGVEWDGTRHPWADIEDYEVAVGYLRIQAAGGTEFLRRLVELGDWEFVVAQLEANVVRQAGEVQVAPTAVFPRSPAPAVAPSPC